MMGPSYFSKEMKSCRISVCLRRHWSIILHYFRTDLYYFQNTSPLPFENVYGILMDRQIWKKRFYYAVDRKWLYDRSQIRQGREL